MVRQLASGPVYSGRGVRQTAIQSLEGHWTAWKTPGESRVPHSKAVRREFPTLPSERELMDSLDGSEQGWEVNSRARCRSHPTVPTARRRRRNQRFFRESGPGKATRGPAAPDPWNRHLPYAKERMSLEQEPVHLASHLLLHTGNDVGVDVQCQLNTGMTHTFGHDLGIHSGLQHDCCVRMTQRI